MSALHFGWIRYGLCSGLITSDSQVCIPKKETEHHGNLLYSFVTLAQTHEHTLIILSKIILAGFQDLDSPACVAELSWACGRVIHHALGFR